jgi:hypothetical protein
MAVEAIRTALPLLGGAVTLGSRRMEGDGLVWRPRDPALRA